MPANNPPLILDGAMGTQLMDRGIKLPLPLWSAEANITNSSDVLSVHHDYINAGANIITTNTFRSTSWSYRKTGLSPKRAQERAKLSLMMAVEAARSSKADLIAGSITAVEDCYRPDLFPGRSTRACERQSTRGIAGKVVDTLGHFTIAVYLEANGFHLYFCVQFFDWQ